MTCEFPKRRRKSTTQLEIGPLGVQATILKYLAARGIWHWRSYNGPTIRGGGASRCKAPTQNPGLPDIIGVIQGGRILMIEVKKEGWKPPKEPATLAINKEWQRYCLQREWLRQCNLAGGLAFFATSLNDVIAGLS